MVHYFSLDVNKPDVYELNCWDVVVSMLRPLLLLVCVLSLVEAPEAVQMIPGQSRLPTPGWFALTVSSSFPYGLQLVVGHLSARIP